MAQPATFQAQTSNRNTFRKGKGSLVRMFMPDGRVITGNAAFKVQGVFCTLDEAPDITMTAINEEDYMGVGKVTERINEGFAIDEFSLVLRGNSQGVLFSMGNLDVGTSGTTAFFHNFEFSGKEFVITYDAYSMDGTRPVYRSTIIRALKGKVMQIPGLAPGSTTQQQITFYNPDITSTPPIDGGIGRMWAFEGWYDNGGTIVNAAAPDGTLTAFVLGTGNGSFATSVTPAAQIIDLSFGATDPRRFFAGIWLNGVNILGRAGDTFTTATNTLTLGSAPADASKLTVAYLVDLTANPTHLPGSDLGPTTTNGNQFWYGWNDWGNQ